jgi:hypothetical protein
MIMIVKTADRREGAPPRLGGASVFFRSPERFFRAGVPYDGNLEPRSTIVAEVGLRRDRQASEAGTEGAGS